MRPQSIVRFEWLSLLALALSAVIMLISFGAIGRGASEAQLPVGMVWIAYAVGFGITLLLIMLVSRRASATAKWILVVLVLAGLVMTLRRGTAIFGEGLVGILDLVQVVLQAGALYFLFTPEARRWFSERAAARSAPS